MPAGRPEIAIDWEELDKLCHIQCTRREVASFFDCSEDTIDNKCKQKYGVNFSAYAAQKGSGGLISLRRKQFHKAIDEGNVVMLIWLGKQYLGQKEIQVTEHSLSKEIFDFEHREYAGNTSTGNKVAAPDQPGPDAVQGSELGPSVG